MTNKKNAQRSTWSQPSPRAEMVAEARTMDPASLVERFVIPHGKAGHIDDEVVVTLLLDAWSSGLERETDTYASELLRRVTIHVKAHVRKNPGWQRLGGGKDEAINDFCQDTVLAILQNVTVPCHAEVAFGDYVYKRCLDTAGKLYAKKNSAGQSLDVEHDDAEATEKIHPPSEPPDLYAPPEKYLIEQEEFLTDLNRMEAIRHIVQTELPEKLRIAFTYRYFASMRISSKKEDVITISKLMGVTEKTVTKYITEAIKIIKQRLTQ